MIGNPNCKHFNGLIGKTCKAGIAYDNIRLDNLEGLNRWPCFNPELKHCVHQVFPTPEEIEAEDAIFAEHFRKTMIARAAIIEHIENKRNVQGSIKCTACPTGTLNFTRASNGHVHAFCTTVDCLNWME